MAYLTYNLICRLIYVNLICFFATLSLAFSCLTFNGDVVPVASPLYEVYLGYFFVNLDYFSIIYYNLYFKYQPSLLIISMTLKINIILAHLVLIIWNSILY